MTHCPHCESPKTCTRSWHRGWDQSTRPWTERRTQKWVYFECGTRVGLEDGYVVQSTHCKLKISSRRVEELENVKEVFGAALALAVDRLVSDGICPPKKHRGSCEQESYEGCTECWWNHLLREKARAEVEARKVARDKAIDRLRDVIGRDRAAADDIESVTVAIEYLEGKRS